MSQISKKSREKPCRMLGDHQKYLSRITKTLYYAKLPKTDRLSLPVTELAADLFSDNQRGRSLDLLYCDRAAEITRNACVSPCSLVLALLYLEKLRKTNPEYLQKTGPSDLFLVSLMVSCKFLYDDGESDEVFMDEWATSAGLQAKELVQLERNFLNAIDWEVYVTELNFWRKLTEIETTIARKEGATRGFFTYTELGNLLSILEIQNFLICFSAISAVLVLSYAATLLTLTGSIFITKHAPLTSIRVKDESNINETNILSETDFLVDYPNAKVDVKTLDVLRTGIFLASIEGLLKPYCNQSKQNATIDRQTQEVSWDWWNVPIMNWLAKTSEFIEKFELPAIGYFGNFLETYVANVKHLELEDQIHKATKTRIQDQMEHSWHEEWTDTINLGFYDKGILYYIQNVKS